MLTPQRSAKMFPEIPFDRPHQPNLVLGVRKTVPFVVGEQVLGWYRAAGSSWCNVGPVTVPTTFVWGTEDIALSRVAADACADYVEAPYEYVVLDQISHWIPEQVPETLSTLILDRVRTV